MSRTEQSRPVFLRDRVFLLGPPDEGSEHGIAHRLQALEDS